MGDLHTGWNADAIRSLVGAGRRRRVLRRPEASPGTIPAGELARELAGGGRRIGAGGGVDAARSRVRLDHAVGQYPVRIGTVGESGVPTGDPQRLPGWLATNRAGTGGRSSGCDPDEPIEPDPDPCPDRAARGSPRGGEHLDEFAARLAHDLKNPLNVARGNLELAREEFDSEHLDAVDRAHERMESLIGDLLALSRMDERSARPEVVDLADVATDCWRNVDTGGATLETETERTVRADASLLKGMLENLVGNAVEHGGEDVTITIGDLAGGTGFYVEDDGPGIPEGEREDVFRSGYSGEAEGTGLGLAIVREVAESHGWEVCLTESEAGGARFEITGVETGSD